jgi:hypothetical protein
MNRVSVLYNGFLFVRYKQVYFSKSIFANVEDVHSRSDCDTHTIKNPEMVIGHCLQLRNRWRHDHAVVNLVVADSKLTSLQWVAAQVIACG